MLTKLFSIKEFFSASRPYAIPSTTTTCGFYEVHADNVDNEILKEYSSVQFSLRFVKFPLEILVLVFVFEIFKKNVWQYLATYLTCIS